LLIRCVFHSLVFPVRERLSACQKPGLPECVRIEISPSSKFANFEPPLMPQNASFTIA
jgi:hypothetical protein